jgi:hypothetical protein
MSSKRSGQKADVHELLKRLADEEQAFLEREFLAPAVAGGSVAVKIGGVFCKLAIEPRDFRGWGIFKPSSHVLAHLVRPATLRERREYLQLFPLVRLILCRRDQDSWLASAGSFGDSRFQLDGLAPVLLAEEVQQFDMVLAHFDGRSFWFDEIDSRHDAAMATYLRQALAERVPAEQVERKGLTAEQRAAYELNYWELEQRPGSRRGRRRELSSPEDQAAQRLHEALSHAGARLVDFLERGDSFRVTYHVGGRQFTSAVDKQDLTVQVAGICLSGEDQKFDLASLVGVLRENEAGYVIGVGEENAGMNEQDYWRVHPPRV